MGPPPLSSKTPKSEVGRLDMKHSRHAPEQIVQKISEADRLLAENIRHAEVA